MSLTRPKQDSRFPGQPTRSINGGLAVCLSPNERPRMKTTLTPVALGLAAVMGLVTASSADAPTSALREGPRIEMISSSAPEAATVRRTGETAIAWLGRRMVYEINRALAAGGPEEAVAVAHLLGVSKDGQALPGMPSITAFKRTSLKLLNAANAPDAGEQQVLDFVDREIRLGRTPHDLIIQRITAPDGSTEWRAYQPLAVLPSCLACHGDPDTQSPRLQTLLRERSPDNAALGYAAGEWRGLLRVTVAPR